MENKTLLEIPPDSVDELKLALKDSTIFVYLVTERKDAQAWKLAISLAKDLPGILPVRIENRVDASAWISKKNDAVSVTFDSKGNVKKRLTKAEAEDRKVVAKALADAMES